MGAVFPPAGTPHFVIRHCITEGDPAVLPCAEYIQLRAKHLDARELLRRARWLRQHFSGKLLINDRFDIALAAGAHGVHLPANRLAPNIWKQRFGAGLIIGVSCHSLTDVQQAADEGADYVYLSPIFPSPSKPGYGPPLGLDVLAEAARRSRIPVLALGGVNAGNIPQCLAAGAAGFASISYFGGS